MSKTGSDELWRLSLWGTFRLHRGDGSRVPISSRKGMALLAMLATAPDGERTRSWLQDRLWGSRGRPQAQQSLRRELSGLRRLAFPEPSLLASDSERVRLDLTRIEIDDSDARFGAVFLEGFDIPREDGFEDWLRDQRQVVRAAPQARSTRPILPSSVDVQQPAPGFGGRPAIAVMPLRDDTLDAGFGYWTEGITDELTERLSRLRWLPVIASSTMFELGAPELTSRSVGQMVGAGYILRGRLADSIAGPVMHLNLIEGGRGQLIWSERFDLSPEMVPELMARLTSDIVAILASRIDLQEQAKVIERPIDNLSASEMVWRARWHMKRLSRRDAAIARDLLGRAESLFPNSAEVLIQYGFALAWDVWSNRGSAEQIERFRALALRARDADPYDDRAYLLLGIAEMWLRRLEIAQELFLEAIRLNPSLANAHGHLGSNYSLSGNPERAIVPLQTALRLSPFDTEVFHQMGELALAYFMLGDPEKAVEFANCALARRPAYFYAHVIKINSLGAMGDRGGARAALRNLLRVKPRFSTDDLDWLPFKDPAWLDTFKRGLAAAGDD